MQNRLDKFCTPWYNGITQKKAEIGKKECHL